MRVNELDARVTAFLTTTRVAFLVGLAVGMVFAGFAIGVLTGEVSSSSLISPLVSSVVSFAVFLLGRRRRAKCIARQSAVTTAST